MVELVEAVAESETDEDTDVAEPTPDKLCAGVVKPSVADTVAVVGTVTGVAVLGSVGKDVNNSGLDDDPDPVPVATPQISLPFPLSVIVTAKNSGEYVAVPEYNGQPGTSVFGGAPPPPQSRNWHSSSVPGTYQIRLAPEMLLVQPDKSVRARVVVVETKRVIRVVNLIISLFERGGCCMRRRG